MALARFAPTTDPRQGYLPNVSQPMRRHLDASTIFVGPAGCGKTTILRDVAIALSQQQARWGSEGVKDDELLLVVWWWIPLQGGNAPLFSSQKVFRRNALDPHGNFKTTTPEGTLNQ